ncbi:unnamed protein product [Calypogeia fissa]
MRTVSVSSQSSPSDERGLGFAWPSLQGSQITLQNLTDSTAKQFIPSPRASPALFTLRKKEIEREGRRGERGPRRKIQEKRSSSCGA